MSQPEQLKLAVPSLNALQVPPPPLAGHGFGAQGVPANETHTLIPGICRNVLTWTRCVRCCQTKVARCAREAERAVSD